MAATAGSVESALGVDAVPFVGVCVAVVLGLTGELVAVVECAVVCPPFDCAVLDVASESSSRVSDASAPASTETLGAVFVPGSLHAINRGSAKNPTPRRLMPNLLPTQVMSELFVPASSLLSNRFALPCPIGVVNGASSHDLSRCCRVDPLTPPHLAPGFSQPASNWPLPETVKVAARLVEASRWLTDHDHTVALTDVDGSATDTEIMASLRALAGRASGMLLTSDVLESDWQRGQVSRRKAGG